MNTNKDRQHFEIYVLPKPIGSKVQGSKFKGYNTLTFLNVTSQDQDRSLAPIG